MCQAVPHLHALIVGLFQLTSPFTQLHSLKYVLALQILPAYASFTRYSWPILAMIMAAFKFSIIKATITLRSLRYRLNIDPFYCLRRKDRGHHRKIGSSGFTFDRNVPTTGQLMAKISQILALFAIRINAPSFATPFHEYQKFGRTPTQKDKQSRSNINAGSTPQSEARTVRPAPMKLSKDWHLIKGRWWFLGDAAELDGTTDSARPSEFSCGSLPKALRDSGLLNFDEQRQLWTVYTDGIDGSAASEQLHMPLFVCELPVVVVLPRSPTLIDRRLPCVMEDVQLEQSGDIDAKAAARIWKLFPFAKGFCVWMNGHLQLMAPHLSELEVSRLSLPTHVAGLNLSVSRYATQPTAGDDEGFLVVKDGLTATQNEKLETRSIPNLYTQSSSIESANSGVRAESLCGWASSSQEHTCTLPSTPPRSSSPARSSSEPQPHIALPREGEIRFQVEREYFQELEDTTPVSLQPNQPQSLVPASIPTYPSHGPDVANELPQARLLNEWSEIKIGNNTCRAGVKVKKKGNDTTIEACEEYLTTSTHAVFQGSSGEELRTRPVQGKSRLRASFRKFFSSRTQRPPVNIIGTPVCDLDGVRVSQQHDL